MLSIRNYVRPQTIEEAYEYAKKPLSVVLGGMLWLKMQNRNVNFAIDLSDLHLDQIEEIDDEIHIGAMVTLRELETNEQLNWASFYQRICEYEIYKRYSYKSYY